MRTVLLSSAAAALLLMAAPQIASAQAAPSDTSVRNPDAQVPVTKALSPTGRSLTDSNSLPADAMTPTGSTSNDVSASTSSDMSATAAAAPVAEPAPMASAAPMASTDASATVATAVVTNGPVADTPENRAKYGSPMSNAGKRTPARGN